MSEPHCTPEELAGYVQGLLCAARARALESHASACDACAEALAEEARVELALYEVVDSRRRAPSRPHRAPSPFLRAAGVGLAGLAMAAAAVLSLGAVSASVSAARPRAVASAPAQLAVSADAACAPGARPCGGDASWQPD